MEEKSSNGRITIIVTVITLVGSITTALIANWDKVFSKSAPTTEVAATTAPKPTEAPTQPIKEPDQPKVTTAAKPQTQAYTGSIGRLRAVYTLIWYADGKISGTYYYPDRHNTNYTLKGKDLNNGNIELTEFTGNKVSAKCHLSLQHDCYQGQMENTDGRSLRMSMCPTH